MIELQDEVAHLRAEVRHLRRLVDELRATSPAGEDQVSDSRSTSRSFERVTSRGSTSGYSAREETRTPERDLPAAAAQPSAAPHVGGSSAACSLSWLEREAICDQIGRFLARSISGAHRGSSGRDKIPLASRLWVVVRDYSGQIYTPVKVVKSWASCKVLCKPSNHECGDSVFVGLPSEREARRVVQAAQLTWPSVIEG